MARPKMTEEQKAAAAAKRLAERNAQQRGESQPAPESAPQPAVATEEGRPTEPAMEPVPAPVPSIESFLRAHESAKADQGVFLVLLRHPDAHADQTHIRDRHDIGVLLEQGPLMVRWSDGSEA